MFEKMRNDVVEALNFMEQLMENGDIGRNYLQLGLYDVAHRIRPNQDLDGNSIVELNQIIIKWVDDSVQNINTEDDGKKIFRIFTQMGDVLIPLDHLIDRCVSNQIIAQIISYGSVETKINDWVKKIDREIQAFEWMKQVDFNIIPLYVRFMNMVDDTRLNTLRFMGQLGEYKLPVEDQYMFIILKKLENIPNILRRNEKLPLVAVYTEVLACIVIGVEIAHQLVEKNILVTDFIEKVKKPLHELEHVSKEFIPYSYERD